MLRFRPNITLLGCEAAEDEFKEMTDVKLYGVNRVSSLRNDNHKPGTTEKELLKPLSRRIEKWEIKSF
jgi:hypothetical protein